jgi:hydroxymethylpyrimidine/phosphomethylpyrimidine kinase / thiaminase
MVSVLEDIQMHALKTGMLFDASIVNAIARTLKTRFMNSRQPPLVCDPVCVSTSGHTLLHSDAIEHMMKDIFPLATVITPNKSEAELLLNKLTGSDHPIIDLDTMLTTSRKLLDLGSRSVLLKGGHLAVSLAEAEQFLSTHSEIRVDRDSILGENIEILLTAEKDPKASQIVVDMLSESDGTVTIFLRPRLDSKSTHGTGCTLSAALACGLAKGLSSTF